MQLFSTYPKIHICFQCSNITAIINNYLIYKRLVSLKDIHYYSIFWQRHSFLCGLKFCYVYYLFAKVSIVFNICYDVFKIKG